ncbi:putative Hydroxysteroid dehydrogenase 2 [Hibiscus syriacus]|uniref:Hydroxysteroid dehydrogenase 2 n=1 Tax=Hibiscus syriacus TaxID=106335 RepID=A0A6A3AMW1_HIBSY|nr:putative Hydroxysteroid dehydrogenase 2 [Hibiscus syriacus]
MDSIHQLLNIIRKSGFITGASSGIGEHVAYEYARKGARLALVARREIVLAQSPIISPARFTGCSNRSCRCFETGRLQNHHRQSCRVLRMPDHLVSNAGIVQLSMFEDLTQISDFDRIMSTNFWGSVYGTHFAVPHLRKNKGKIIVIASIADGFLFQNTASTIKGSANQLYETLRVEFGSDIGITIAMPGLIYTDLVLQQSYTSEVQIDFVRVHQQKDVPSRLWQAFAVEMHT